MDHKRRGVDDWLRQGAQQQRLGLLAEAETAYCSALALSPDHPTGLHLLGSLKRSLGQLPEAEALLRRSLASDRRQGVVWNSLGNLLAASSRWQEALASFDAALQCTPGLAEAHFNRSRALRQLGQVDEALVSVRQAQACSPRPTAGQVHLEALIRADQGALDDAVSLMNQAIQLAPDKPTLLHDLATLHQRQHRFAQALQFHDRAAQLGLDAADAHYNRGNSLQSLGQMTEAAQAYRRALKLQPGHALALYDLARLRWRQGEADFDAELIDAGKAGPSSLAARGVRAQLLLKAERFEEATAAYRQALEMDPNAPGLLSGLAQSLAKLGDLPAALLQHQKAARFAPGDGTVQASWALALLQAGRHDQAVAAAADALVAAPDDQFAWAVQGLVWRCLGDPREPWLNDYQRLVAVIDLPAPVGFPSVASFSEALGHELANLHRDTAAPVDQTLRRGTQTLGDIFEQGHPLVNLLKRQIAAAIDDHTRSLHDDAIHPFLSRRQPAWHFTDSWSSRLGQGGFHTHHVHPHGWMSSAYYVQVPPVCADAVQQEGWLQFGSPQVDLGFEQPVRRMVEPRPGRLVLFPSMFWHGTVPFFDDAVRTTIAFDVKPGALAS